MGKLTIPMAIFNSYFDITRGYSLQIQEIPFFGSLPIGSLEGWPASAVLELHGKKGQEVLHSRDGPHGEIPTINGGFDLGMGQNQ
jgi:hypothetical protein